MVDLHGRTDAAGLYAVGEVTQSGLHGANRLAIQLACSNASCSGEAAAQHIAANFDEPAGRAGDPRVGRKPRHRQPTRKW